MDKFIFYLGWSILNYEIAFRYDTEMQCQKNYLSLEQPAQEAERFSMVKKSLSTDCLKFWIRCCKLKILCA